MGVHHSQLRSCSTHKGAPASEVGWEQRGPGGPPRQKHTIVQGGTMWALHEPSLKAVQFKHRLVQCCTHLPWIWSVLWVRLHGFCARAGTSAWFGVALCDITREGWSSLRDVSTRADNSKDPTHGSLLPYQGLSVVSQESQKSSTAVSSNLSTSNMIQKS